MRFPFSCRRVALSVGIFLSLLLIGQLSTYCSRVILSEESTPYEELCQRVDPYLFPPMFVVFAPPRAAEYAISMAVPGPGRSPWIAIVLDALWALMLSSSILFVPRRPVKRNGTR